MEIKVTSEHYCNLSTRLSIIAVSLIDVCWTVLFCSFVTAGQTVLAEGQSGTRAYGWHTLSLTVNVSGDLRF